MVEIRIDNTPYQIPADLSEITLGRFLQYWDQYGRSLDADLANIQTREYEDEFDREADLSTLEDEEAMSWYSFWTGIDREVLKAADASPLIVLYRSIRQLLTQSEDQAYDFPTDIEWNGQVWEIADFKVTPGSAFTFNELLTSKEVIRQIRAIGKGRWDALPYLCAVFFRLKGEAFRDELIYPDSERMTLLKTLPLTHALQVAFFLTVSMGIWRKVLAFSRVAAKQTADS